MSTGIHAATYFGLETAVVALLQYGIDPNVRDVVGDTSLTIAAERDERLELIIEAKTVLSAPGIPRQKSVRPFALIQSWYVYNCQSHSPVPAYLMLTASRCCKSKSVGLSHCKILSRLSIASLED